MLGLILKLLLCWGAATGLAHLTSTAPKGSAMEALFAAMMCVMFSLGFFAVLDHRKEKS